MTYVDNSVILFIEGVSNMPRPVICRRIGQMPAFRVFSPDDAPEAENIYLSLDEFETLRLIDYEGLKQESCAAKMNISRTTVTAIYESARHKISDALVNGKKVIIAGGYYEFTPTSPPENLREKGDQGLRIAVTYDQGNIFQHFGRTEQFKLYDVENGTISQEQIVDTNGISHGALAGFLQATQADALICGGIGMGAKIALEEAGIQLYPGVSGKADTAAKALAGGSLHYDPDAHCDHHL